MSVFDQFPYTDLHEINLDWLIRTVQKTWDKTTATQTQLDELQTQVDEIGENLGEEVDRWLREQGESYVQEIIKDTIASSVYFGLSDDGYFVAYVPATWKNIFFNTTGVDIDVALEPEYGHLILSY